MKTQNKIITLSAAQAIALLAGCDKPADSNQPAAGDQPAKETKSVSESLNEAAKPVVQEVEKAAKEVQAAVTNVAADATSKANELIGQAKKLVSEAKYSDAMSIVNQLSTMKLTTEQEKLVADLKAQIQKAMTSLSTTNAAGAIGNLLK